LEYSLHDDIIRSGYKTWLLLFAAGLDDEDILVECILKWPNSLSSAVRYLNSNSEIFNNESSNIIKSLHPIFNNSRSKSVMTLHVCGHERVGKSQTVQSLKRTFNSNYFTKPWNNEQNADIALGDDGHTIGMESHSNIKFNYHDQYYQIVINDYGGHEAFHVNHSRFLSIKNSIYIIVLPLYDKRTNDIVDINTIIKMFKYWMDLIRSLAMNPDVLLILNFVKFSEAKYKNYSKNILQQLIPIISSYNSNDVHFLSSTPIALDSICPREICDDMWPLLKESIHNLKVKSDTIIPLIGEFLKYKKNQKWPFLMKTVELENKIQIFFLQSSMKSHISNITNPKILKCACRMMINMLISKRDVVTLRLSGKDVCVVDVTCFASEVLGAIFNPVTSNLGLDDNLRNKRLTIDCCLTNDIIYNRINNLSTINKDVNIIALLCQMGLCIPVSIDNDSNSYISSIGSIDESETSMYCFPAFASKLMELHDGTPIKGNKCHNYV
jgi:hypothetical protein